ncbi:MAG: hypothetical protein FRX49_04237 [Trebouxia sp. A1-2]|nr:MAG: hypothetical protein FRX49_04237 [Trebouxia sp. A1-2]
MDLPIKPPPVTEALNGARITLKEVGVPLTGVGLAAATDWEPATGMGAVSPATVSPQVSKGENTLSKDSPRVPNPRGVYHNNKSTSHTKSVLVVSRTVLNTAPSAPAKQQSGQAASQGQSRSSTCDAHAREVVHEQGNHVNKEDDGNGSGVEDHLHHRETRVSKAISIVALNEGHQGQQHADHGDAAKNALITHNLEWLYVQICHEVVLKGLGKPYLSLQTKRLLCQRPVDQ